MSIDSGNYRHSHESYNPTPASYNWRSLSLVLAFVILVFFLLGFFSIYIVRYFMQLFHNAALSRNRNHSPNASGGGEQSSRPFSRGLDPAIIASFPTFGFSSAKDLPAGRNSPECPVCLAEFSEGELLKHLIGCKHLFHRDCVDLWFAQHNTCPVCRLELDSVPVKSCPGATSLHLQDPGEINSSDPQREHVVVTVVELADRPPSPESPASERVAEEGSAGGR